MTAKLFWPALGLAAMLLATGASYADSAADRRAKEDGKASASAEKKRRPAIYIPPSRGAPKSRAGGGTRASGVVPELAALVPDHIGHTLEASPRLAWHATGPAEAPVELTVIRDGAVEPLLEVQVATRLDAGVGEASLARWQVELEPGAVYDWSIAVVIDPDQRDRDVVASGSIRRLDASEVLSAPLPREGARFRTLASHGIWYDALADLNAAIRSGRSDLEATRADLLAEVGLRLAPRAP